MKTRQLIFEPSADWAIGWRNSKRDLQAFLIKRFIYILVLVTVAQSLISF